MSRKTTTSNEVKKRYNDKAYHAVNVKFRYDRDADIIEALNALKAQGMGTTEAICALIRKS